MYTWARPHVYKIELRAIKNEYESEKDRWVGVWIFLGKEGLLGLNFTLLTDWNKTLVDVSLMAIKINTSKALINSKHKGWWEYKRE